MDRALREFRIRGVATNLAFLENVIGHPHFRDVTYTTRFIDETPELTALVKRRDRATKLLNYIADVTVNGHPETRGRAEARPARAATRRRRVFDGASGRRHEAAPRPRRAGKLRALDARREARRSSPTRRCATRTSRCSPPACARTTSWRSPPAYAAALPELLSLECWGGATFDVAMRFLTEDPWERLAGIRARVPNILLQMLLRGANGVGYTNYPDNVVRFFVREAADGGHRPLPRLRLPELGRRTCASPWTRCCEIGKALRGGDLLHRRPPRPVARRNTTSPTTSALARELEKRRRAHHRGEGHGGRDEARRRARPLQGAARRRSQRRSTSTRTTRPASPRRRCWPRWRRASTPSTRRWIRSPASPRSPASARSSRRSTRPTARPASTSKRSAASRSTGRRCASSTRAFESDLRSGASEVYLHEMPGGQFTNLKEQARSLGLESALARGGARLCRGEPPVRRHRQGHALLEGGRRHGADDGDAGAFAPPTCSTRRATSPSRIPSCR